MCLFNILLMQNNKKKQMSVLFQIKHKITGLINASLECS